MGKLYTTVHRFYFTMSNNSAFTRLGIHQYLDCKLLRIQEQYNIGIYIKLFKYKMKTQTFHQTETQSPAVPCPKGLTLSSYRTPTTNNGLTHGSIKYIDLSNLVGIPVRPERPARGPLHLESFCSLVTIGSESPVPVFPEPSGDPVPVRDLGSSPP